MKTEYHDLMGIQVHSDAFLILKKPGDLTFDIEVDEKVHFG